MVDHLGSDLDQLLPFILGRATLYKGDKQDT
jgi:hypothetical protein